MGRAAMEMQRYVDEQRRHPPKIKRSSSRSTPVDDEVEIDDQVPAESPASESQPAQSAPQEQEQQETSMDTSTKKAKSKKPRPAAKKPTEKKATKKAAKASKSEKAKISGPITDVKPQSETFLRLIFGDSGGITLRVQGSGTDSSRTENRDLVVKMIRDLLK